MGRIRTIKPEILTDAKAAGLSDMAWRLWVSTWLLADDEGRFPADDIILAGQVFPGRSSRSIHGALTEVSNKGLIGLYEVNGQRYGLVNGWKKHQKINRASGPKFPAPCDGFSEPSVSPHGGCSADHDHDHDHDHDRGAPTRASTARMFAAAVVGELNALTGSKFQEGAKQTLLDSEVLSKDYTPDQARAVVRDKVNEWTGTENEKYLCPATLIRPANFRRYIESLEGRPGSSTAGEPEGISLGFDD